MSKLCFFINPTVREIIIDFLLHMQFKVFYAGGTVFLTFSVTKTSSDQFGA